MKPLLQNSSLSKPNPVTLVVFKKDEDARKENYRPVSVLTTLPKVYEKVMSPLVTKPLWISKKPFVLHRSSENDRGLEKEP